MFSSYGSSQYFKYQVYKKKGGGQRSQSFGRAIPHLKRLAWHSGKKNPKVILLYHYIWMIAATTQQILTSGCLTLGQETRFR
ncbi:hypothetical protein F7734_31490 [Scytonema sp. UIC 10036]|uniref:hypothetical protein n=1 Tax=Scytonema sp. UIC 10036 TaxID=2304196 RepID=UPI0012DA4BF9|nr:hypothetical protein [Scytonema sp. UIC 10036]MUG96618.1 hypothetical protein [Scytonema sp. UIC 10036]